jgi:hypothetical protein
MGQSSIILGIAATIILGLLLYASQSTSARTDVALADYTYKVLAREAAATGLNLTVRKLVEDPEDWTVSEYGFAKTGYHNADFVVVVTAVHADTVDIRSTGSDDSGVQIIEARYAKGYSIIAVPPAFKYAIITDEDLTLNGQAEVLSVDDEANANIHANGDLTSNGSQVDVAGYASFDADGGSGVVNPERAIDEIFQPNDDTNDSESNLIEGEHIDIPELNPDDYDSAPVESDSVHTGDMSLTGTIDFVALGQTVLPGGDMGTVDNPFRLFVDGNLDLSGGVIMLGYVQVITQGNITITGNVTSSVVPVPDKTASDAEKDAWTEANLDAAGNTKIGWYANGSITISGGSSVVGQLYANESITLNGGGGEEMNIIGGITSTNVNIDVNGGIVIQYAEISKMVVIPGFTLIVPEGVRLLDWVEW